MNWVGISATTEKGIVLLHTSRGRSITRRCEYYNIVLLPRFCRPQGNELKGVMHYILRVSRNLEKIGRCWNSRHFIWWNKFYKISGGIRRRDGIDRCSLEAAISKRKRLPINVLLESKSSDVSKRNFSNWLEYSVWKFLQGCWCI